jgi:hypothetical protein
MSDPVARLRVLLCLLYTVLFALTAHAQFRAGIQGTVTDTTGGVIPGATVTVVSSETGKTDSLTTNDPGFYRVDGLPPGTYTVSAELPGFKKQTVQNVAASATHADRPTFGQADAGLAGRAVEFQTRLSF